MSEFETQLRELAKQDVGLAIKYMRDVLQPDQPHFLGEGDIFIFCSTPNKEIALSEILEESESMLKEARQIWEDELEGSEDEEA